MTPTLDDLEPLTVDEVPLVFPELAEMATLRNSNWVCGVDGNGCLWIVSVYGSHRDGGYSTGNMWQLVGKGRLMGHESPSEDVPESWLPYMSKP